MRESNFVRKMWPRRVRVKNCISCRHLMYKALKERETRTRTFSRIQQPPTPPSLPCRCFTLHKTAAAFNLHLASTQVFTRPMQDNAWGKAKSAEKLTHCYVGPMVWNWWLFVTSKGQGYICIFHPQDLGTHKRTYRIRSNVHSRIMSTQNSVYNIYFYNFQEKQELGVH